MGSVNNGFQVRIIHIVELMIIQVGFQQPFYRGCVFELVFSGHFVLFSIFFQSFSFFSIPCVTKLFFISLDVRDIQGKVSCYPKYDV